MTLLDALCTCESGWRTEVEHQLSLDARNHAKALYLKAQIKDAQEQLDKLKEPK